MQHDDVRTFTVRIHPQEDDCANLSAMELQGALENYYEDVWVTEVEA